MTQPRTRCTWLCELCQFLRQTVCDGVQEGFAGNSGSLEARLYQTDQIFGHDAGVERIKAGFFQFFAKVDQIVQAIQLTALFQCARR